LVTVRLATVEAGLVDLVRTCCFAILCSRRQFHSLNKRMFLSNLLLFPCLEGLGYGLGAMGGNRGGGVNQQVQYEQQKDLAQTTAELEVAKQKEADLEQRIKALESGGAVQPAQVAPAVSQ